jgi:hypothetical protein
MADPTDAPALPYAVAYRPFGPSASRVEHPVKVRPGGLDGEILTPDELAVWAYVQHLEAKLARLDEVIQRQAALTADVDQVAAEVRDLKKKGKK